MADIDDFFPFNDELGYLGVPYVPVLIAAMLNSKLDPNIVAVSSATGITAGRGQLF